MKLRGKIMAGTGWTLLVLAVATGAFLTYTLPTDTTRAPLLLSRPLVYSLLAGLTAASVLLGLLLLWGGDRASVRRISKLNKAILKIHKQQAYTELVTEEGHDEITQLAHSINRLMESVARTQSTNTIIEKQFHESEQRYRMLFNGMVTGFALHEIICDDTGKPQDYRFLAVNPAFERLTGLKADKLIGHTVREILPHIEASWIERYGHVAQTGTPIFFEDFSGDLKRSFSIKAFCPSPGQFAVIIEDITERKRMEQERYASEEKFRKLTTLAPVGVLLTDAQGHCQYVNDKWLEMAGLSFTEALGDTWMKVVHPEDHGNVIATWERAVAARGQWALEFRVQTPDGRMAWVYGLATPLLDAQGNLTGYIGAHTDLTERKRADEERIKRDAQFQQTQKLESLGILAGGIAHDFNNILMAILGNVDLALVDLPPTSPAHVYLGDVEKATRRAAELCRQMLAYSGKGRFVIERVNLNNLIGEMSRMLEVSVSKKAILRYHFTAQLPPVEVDITQIQQILMNLVINASEAIGESSGFISISTGAMKCDQDYLADTWLKQKLPEGIYVYIEVADTGCGMTPKTLECIFDPFFTTKFTGRGLGLAAVLGIVRGHKGTLKIYSEPGHGSTFKVLLPAAKGEAPNLVIKDPAKKLWHGTGTILLVDDEETIRVLSKQMLERLGFRVLTAADGCEALTIFRAQQREIVAILLDLTMPHMDGEETFRELQRIKTDVPIIMSSGYNEQDIAQRFDGKGLAGFIQKPYRMAMLSQTLRATLEGKRDAVPRAQAPTA